MLRLIEKTGHSSQAPAEFVPAGSIDLAKISIWTRPKHMFMKRYLRNGLSVLVQRHGYRIIAEEHLYDWQRMDTDLPRGTIASLPDEATAYLKPENPALLDLQKRYKSFRADVTAPLVWNEQLVTARDIAYFRSDSPWVWQVRGKNANTHGYSLAFYYLKSIDRLGLFDKLVEDEAFGNFVLSVGGLPVSRDLLDSVAEICFLDRHLRLGSRTEFRILDVGAGYGRLAHRMVSALSGVERYYCTDAVAVSTFVSGYYLRFRRADKAVVVPLDKIEDSLRQKPVDLAININSFPECRIEAIEWWTRLLSKNRVKHLMIAVRGERLLTNDGQNFLPLLERYGYRTVLKEPKYLDPVVQEFGLYPGWHHLLEFRE
jgi:hypothetical protein